MKGRSLLGALLTALLLLEAGCESWCEHRYPCQQACCPSPCYPAPACQPAASYAPVQPVPAYQGTPGYPCPCAPGR
jgi:hypothetical protein